MVFDIYGCPAVVDVPVKFTQIIEFSSGIRLLVAFTEVNGVYRRQTRHREPRHVIRFSVSFLRVAQVEALKIDVAVFAGCRRRLLDRQRQLS